MTVLSRPDPSVPIEKTVGAMAELVAYVVLLRAISES